MKEKSAKKESSAKELDPTPEKVSQTSYLTLSRRAFISRCAVGILLVNLFVFAMTGMSLRQSRHQYQAQAVVTTQNLARLLEVYISGIADKVDLSLLGLASHVERRLSRGGIDGAEMDGFIDRQLARLPEMDSQRVVNAKGEIVYGTGAAAELISVADRDYFKRLRRDPGAGLMISEPVLERVSAKWVLMLARRINNPDGSFAGVALGGIRLQHFVKIFAAINVGKHGTISLRDGALARVLRYPEHQEVNSSGAHRGAAPRRMQELVLEGSSSGSYQERSNLDRMERTYSFHRIEKQPLFVVAALSESDYLAEWRREAAERWTLVAFFTLFTVACSLLIYRDWTRRKGAVQDLAQQEAKFRTIADFPFDWEFWLNADGSYIHSSPSCLRVTGYGAEAFYADPKLLDRIMLPEDLGLFVAHRHEALENAVPGELAFRIRHADGRVRWLGHVCRPIIDPSGVFLGTRGSNRDITDRKRAEEEIRTLNDELELRVTQAVEEVRAKDRLMIIQSRQAAMGEMIHNIAHQWRQPLNNLGLLIQSIIFDHQSDELTPARLHRYREQGMELINYMSQTIDGFRNFFRADKEVQRFSIAQSAQKAYALLAATLKEERIKVIIDGGEGVYIDGYPNEYAQAVVNLLGNACEVLLEREVAQPVICVQARREGEFAVLTVRDNAGGIPDDIIGRVFDPYFTTKDGVGVAGAGSGIGLYMSKTIVERHMGGSLTVANVDGGAEFKIEVRVAQAKGTGSDGDSPAPAVPGVTAASLPACCSLCPPK